MKNNTIKLKSADIIAKRDEISTEISKYWKIIRAENILSSKEIKAGLGSGKDLKALYNTITQLQQKRIKTKALLMYLNMGYTEFKYDEFKKTNNYSIFAACEAKEAIAQLKMIPTIDPTAKAKKAKSTLGKKETFTSAKIASLLKNLQLEANKYNAEMEKFNSSTEISFSDPTFIEEFTT